MYIYKFAYMHFCICVCNKVDEIMEMKMFQREIIEKYTCNLLVSQAFLLISHTFIDLADEIFDRYRE